MILFISDLHLSANTARVNHAFCQFMQNHAGQAEAIYILGDLFDAWIGDDDPSPWLAPVKQAIKQCVSLQTRVFFMRGNRDFMVDKQFAIETGAELLADPTAIAYGGQKMLLMHGDLLCTDDIDYQRFRRWAQRPWIKWILRHLPLKKRMQIANEMRAKSQRQNQHKTMEIMDANEDAVCHYMQHFQCQLLIHGHTHRPATHSHKTGKRIVLGDWHNEGWFVAVTGESITLEPFAIGNPSA